MAVTFISIQVFIRWKSTEQSKELYVELDGAVSRYNDANEYWDGKGTGKNADRKVPVSVFYDK